MTSTKTRKRGIFLCIEGGDGSGKGTQHELLAKQLKAVHQPVLTVDFPRYGEPSAELVELYLNNAFGEATKLDPRLASVPYAIDRLAASPQITEALEMGQLVLANRFSASSMAHQGAKFPTKQERLAFFRWLHQLEHEIMHIPEPDYYFILHVPAAIAQQRVLQKADRSYTTQKLDAHEASLGHLEQAEQTYLDLAETFPNRFGLVECMDGERARTVEEIQIEIWERVQELIHA